MKKVLLMILMMCLAVVAFAQNSAYLFGDPDGIVGENGVNVQGVGKFMLDSAEVKSKVEIGKFALIEIPANLLGKKIKTTNFLGDHLGTLVAGSIYDGSSLDLAFDTKAQFLAKAKGMAILIANPSLEDQIVIAKTGKKDLVKKLGNATVGTFKPGTYGVFTSDFTKPLAGCDDFGAGNFNFEAGKIYYYGDTQYGAKLYELPIVQLVPRN